MRSMAQIEKEKKENESYKGKVLSNPSESNSFIGDDSTTGKEEKDSHLTYILFWAVIIGLVMNWLSLYLNISMGLVSVGIGPMAVLLIGKQILRWKQLDTRQNLVIIMIAYGATQAAEAAIGLLFMIWLTKNAVFFFGIPFNPPWWLLPSETILSKRTILSSEWAVPLAVHYFLMLVPGILGIILGYYMKDKFIHDDNSYPFPNMISQTSQVGVLTDEAGTRGPIFWRIAKYGFIVSLLTILVPGLFIIDISNIPKGFLFGIMLGPVGVSLFAAGILIGKPKITVTPFFVSFLAYSLLGVFFYSGGTDMDYFDYFTVLLQDYYFVPALALMLGGLILGPLVLGMITASIFKKSTQEKEDNVKGSIDSDNEKNREQRRDNYENDQLEDHSVAVTGNKKLITVFAMGFVAMVIFVDTLNILSVPFWLIVLLIFWNVILGTVVKGFVTAASVAKSGSAISPPFVFDVVPIFLAGGRGFTPYISMPNAETDGVSGVISALKISQMNNVKEKNAIHAYIAGYLATSLTTPLFALMMWSAFDIGTAKFPAPAFPIQGAILAGFASGDIESFINIKLFLIFLLVSILVSGLGQDFILGMIIGLLFIPHMAFPMALGGIVRIWMERKYGKEKASEKSVNLGPALATGASFVIPIMIVIALL